MSVWTESAALPEFQPLKGDLRCEVLVVGGGLAGLLCAHELRRAGLDCALLEADRLCGGTTAGTTAKITAQHGLIYDKLIRKYGVGRAEMYLRANLTALERFRELCRDVDCGFEERDSWVYSRTDAEKLRRERDALRHLGVPVELTESAPLPFPVSGALRFPSQAQFDPLRFAAAIAEGLQIYEHSAVRELAPHRAVTDGGSVTAENIIIATHFPILNKHGGYFFKLYQHRSYVLALEGAEAPEGMFVDEDCKGLSLRRCGELLLLGGGSHRTGKKGGGWRELEETAARYWPGCREVGRWAAQDCMSLDGVPYIGPYSTGTEGLYVATGFNKWGMTSSMVAALLLTDMVRGVKSENAAVFSPSRSVLSPQLAVNGAEALLDLLTPTAPRCPHMGCALKWNAAERSWDCPCHGSRFEQGGGLQDGPATGGLKS